MDPSRNDNFGELLAALSGSNQVPVPHSGSGQVPVPQAQTDPRYAPQYVWQAPPPPVYQYYPESSHAQPQYAQPQPAQPQYHQPQPAQSQYSQPQPAPQQQQYQPQHYTPPIPQYVPPVHQNQATKLEPVKVAKKKSFPIVLLTIGLIVLGFAFLAVWYYSKKNVLADSVPEVEHLPPPKLFLVSEEEENSKLLQDSYVIENLEKYLHLNEKDVDTKNEKKKSKFTKLSEVMIEEEEPETVEEVEVEVNGFKKKMAKRIDSESPEISEYMKRREQAEKENLKWIESQRERNVDI
jgi:hypothetical protein